MRHLLIVFLFMSCFVEICLAVDAALTINVVAGGRECFIQEIAANSEYEIEYQVRVFVSL